MSNQRTWLLILGALAIAGFIWAIDEKNKRKALNEHLNVKNQDYLKLLHSYLEDKKSLPNEIKEQLIHLREEYIGLQDDVAIELKTIIELIDSNKEEIAIEKLTKVIENLLKEKYIAEGKAKDKRSCPKLFKLLELALNLNWISKHEHLVATILKDKRNDEAHELAVKYPSNWKYIALLSGIELIYKLKGVKRVA
jgi:hypothetical protein